MTPARHREQLQAELAGLTALLESAPEDPLATPLMRSRVEEIEETLRELHAAPSRAEAEIFFVDGPAIGSEGIEITFASDVLESYQNMVTNHYTAKVYGSPRRSGRRRKEDETRLYLTALPRGSFGFQLSQPYSTGLLAAQNMPGIMSNISELIEATAESDTAFEAALTSFDSRVFRPLKRFITTIHHGGGACRLLTGEKQTSLSVEKIAEAYARISAAVADDEEVTMSGTFGGFHAISGDFEFQPDVGKIIHGGLNAKLTAPKIKELSDNFFQRHCIAKMMVTTVTARTGSKKPTYELVTLLPAKEEKKPIAK